MNDRNRKGMTRLVRIGWIAMLAVVLGGTGLWIAQWYRHGPRVDLTDIPTTSVRRTDLFGSIRAGGKLSSSKQTQIECELEALAFWSKGRIVATKGASTILTVAKEGANVKAGDVLCTLDSSDYEELVRQQEMEVMGAKADLTAAELQMGKAETALAEYRDGLSKQNVEQLNSQIALGQSDFQRSKDRLEWTNRMVDLGYVPSSQLSAGQQDRERAEITLQLAQKKLNTFETFSFPKALRSYEAQLEGYRSQLTYQRMRFKVNTDRLTKYREQVAFCTIRAPHDGMLIYANQNDPTKRIDEGAVVRQKQILFYLPDLSRMEVEAYLNESVVNRVTDGMSAKIRLEALPQYKIEGHVVSVSPLPMPMSIWRSSDDVKTYVGLVQLHSVPEGFRPGMTAEVEILTSQRPAALVIPPSALKVEDGRDFCFVVAEEGLERREVAIGQVTPNLLEVRSGLEEGEEVVLEPSSMDPSDLAASGVSTAATAPAAPPVEVAQNKPSL